MTGRVGGRPSLAGATGAAFVAVGLVAGVERLHDNSFLTHLATGRLIRADGIPRVDPYSFTAGGEPWVVQSWLPSWVYASLESWWGLDGVRVITGLLCAAIAGILWASTREVPTLIPRVAVAAVGLAAMVGFFAERPLLVGFIGVGMVVLACDGRIDPRWLVPLGWVWVSSHGSFPIGVVVAVVLLVGAALDRSPVVEERRALLWLLGGILLGAANPLGPRLLWFPVELLGRSQLLREFVREWQPPSFDTGSEQAFLALIVLAVAALVWRPSWRSAAAIAVFVPVALMSRRNVPIAVIVLLPVVARSLPAVGSITGEERRPLAMGVGVAVVAVAGLAVVTRLEEPATALQAYPVEEVLALEEAGAVGPDAAGRLLVPDFVGNYLDARYGRDAQVFIDDRYDLYSTEVLDDYAVFHELAGDPAEVLERYEFEVVLWRAEAPLRHWLDAAEDWVAGPDDEDWAVFCRDGSDLAGTACG